MEIEYLQSVIKRFRDYKLLAERTIDQVNEKDLNFKYNEECNSIVTLVKHLHGNMLSRWTDFLTSDGEKEWRERDSEFEESKITKKELLSLWNEGWDCLFKTLESLTKEDLIKTIHIRKEPLSALDAINRQLAHYSYHVGQIVFIGKMLVDKDWKSLSIPRGKSKEFNAVKISGSSKK
jgi:hypothetical protein